LHGSKKFEKYQLIYNGYYNKLMNLSPLYTSEQQKQIFSTGCCHHYYAHTVHGKQKSLDVNSVYIDHCSTKIFIQFTLVKKMQKHLQIKQIF